MAARKGMTLKALADKVGVSKQSMNYIASAENPTIGTLISIAEALECSTHELYDDGLNSTIECPICKTKINIRTKRYKLPKA